MIVRKVLKQMLECVQKIKSFFVSSHNVKKRISPTIFSLLFILHVKVVGLICNVITVVYFLKIGLKLDQ